jgi:hypothetical protein
MHYHALTCSDLHGTALQTLLKDQIALRQLAGRGKSCAVAYELVYLAAVVDPRP